MVLLSLTSDEKESTTSTADEDKVAMDLISASLDYMRTPTPEQEELATPGAFWILESGSRKSCISSPVLSCPPGWLEAERECDNEISSQGSNEDDEDHLLNEVPLSSSPPDFATSSPKSAGSGNSDEMDSSVTSGSTRCFAFKPFVKHDSQEENPSNAFAHRLHNLLLVALKEKEMDSGTEDTNSLSGDDSNDTSTSSIEYDCSGEGTLQARAREKEEATYLRSVFEKSTSAPLTYRLIKRAQSYEASRDPDEPILKRQKMSRDTDADAKVRVYAHRTASLRRADSLKYTAGNKSCSPSCAPTVPATPLATTPKQRTRQYGLKRAIDSDEKVIQSPIPIIAPPLDHVSSFPLSPETAAKMRLMRCLEREASGREMDGLPPGVCQRPPLWMLEATIKEGLPLIYEDNSWSNETVVEWEIVLGIGRKRRLAAINWIIDVLPIKTPGRAPSPESESVSTRSSWSSEGYSTGTSSSDHSPDLARHSRPIYNLQDQLENSPQTRFHAVWMFLRYFYLTMSPDTEVNANTGSSSSTLPKSGSFDQEGLDLVVWDIAVACLAISVKFHRDFLHPLLPVFADEYINLAPHSLSLGDLESAHRDILSAFDYRLGITPQPIMDELWLALPSLRSLLYFYGGWKNAKLEAWSRLFSILDAPDIQRFTVSILTVVVLMDGIIESLVDNLCDEQQSSRVQCSSHTASERYIKNQLLRNKLAAKAKDDAEGVFCDIQAVTGITDANIRECRVWMAGRI